MSREEFTKRQEIVADIIQQVGDKQNEISTIDAQIYSIQVLIDGIGQRISDIDKRQETVANLIAQRDQLQKQRDAAQDELTNQQDQLNQANEAYNRLSKDSNGNSVYVDFDKVLKSLNWSQLNQDNGRETLAANLKNKIENDFSDLAGQYTDQEYKSLIDGFVNRQEGADITVKYLDNLLSNTFNNVNLYNKKYHELLEDEFDYGYAYSYSKVDIYTNEHIYKDYYFNENYNLNPNYNNYYLNSFPIGIELNIVERLNNLFNIEHSNATGPTQYNGMIEDIYLTNSAKKENSLFNTLMYNMYAINSSKLNISTFLLPPLKERDVNNTNYSTNISGRDINDILTPNGYIGSDTTSGYRYSVERTIKKFDNVNTNLSSNDIYTLNTYITKFEKYYDQVDFDNNNWFFDLTGYKDKWDKVKAYNEKIKDYIESYNQLKAEQAKPLSEQNDQIINELNATMLESRKIIAEGLNDVTNFSWSIVDNLQINKEVIEREFAEYLPEVEEFYNQVDKRIRTYDKDNPIVHATKEKSEELKKAVTDAQKTVDNTQRLIDNLINQISNLGLSPDDETLADRKQEQEKLLIQRQEELQIKRQELADKQADLAKLNQDLADSSLANIGKNSMAEGHNAFASGENAIAYGSDALAVGKDSIALGSKAAASEENATAVGSNSQALAKDSTALGSKAVAAEENATAVGSNAQALAKDSTALGSKAVAAEENATAVGSNAQALAKDSTALGSKAVAMETNSTALGNNAIATKKNATAIGQNAQALAENSVALGQGSLATAENEISVGNELTGLKRKINNVANGLISDTSSEAVTGQQLYGVAQILGANITSDGLIDAEFEYYQDGDVKKTKNVKTAIKAISQNNRYVSVNSAGNAAAAKGNESIAIGGNSIAMGTNSVAIGSGSVAMGDNELSVGNAQTGLSRRITNVADGVADSDAATVGQLNRGIANIDRKLQKTEKRLSSGIAGAYAAASLVNASAPSDSMLSVGTGTYNGTAAVAVGYSKVSDNGKVTLKLLGSANNKGEMGGGASIGYKF